MFSELVDRCVSISGRPDQLTSITACANEVLRTISKRGDWPDDSMEEIVPTPPGQSHVVWTPEVGRSRFRREEYIEDARGAEPTAVRPSRRIRDISFYYYRSGDSFVFNGAVGDLKIYYYAYQPWLRYYAVGSRPSVFDLATGEWTDPSESALAQVTNWMLERHNAIVEAGTLQRFFASKQDARQGLYFSIFNEGISDIQRAEGIEQILGNRRG